MVLRLFIIFIFLTCGRNAFSIGCEPFVSFEIPESSRTWDVLIENRQLVDANSKNISKLEDGCASVCLAHVRAALRYASFKNKTWWKVTTAIRDFFGFSTTKYAISLNARAKELEDTDGLLKELRNLLGVSAEIEILTTSNLLAERLIKHKPIYKDKFVIENFRPDNNTYVFMLGTVLNRDLNVIGNHVIAIRNISGSRVTVIEAKIPYDRIELQFHSVPSSSNKPNPFSYLSSKSLDTNRNAWFVPFGVVRITLK